MDSYSEVRRVRRLMSERAGHDIRALITLINERRQDSAARIIDPGTSAEQTHAPGPVIEPALKTSPSAPVR